MAKIILPSRDAPEQWRLVVGNPDYRISDHGNVQRATPGKNTAPGRPLAFVVTKTHGYLAVTLCWPGMVRRFIKVHRLVAEAFIPNESNLPSINHKNFDKTDNHVSNLEWCNQSQNLLHAHAGGRVSYLNRRGEGNNNSKLIASQIQAIRLMSAKGVGMLSLACMFGVTRAHIWEIVTRRVWAHID
jgi:hypothetical protein